MSDTVHAPPVGHSAQASTARRIGRLWLGVRVVALLAILPLALWALPVARVVAWLTPRSTPSARDDTLLADAVRWVDALVDRRPFHFWGHCVRRSLTLYYAATRAGYPVTIALGVRREGESVIGHAWLELDGAPFLEKGNAPDKHYTVMRRLPLSRA